MSSLALMGVQLLAVAVPLVLLARVLRVYPERGLILLLVVAALASLGVVVREVFLPPLLAFDGLIALVAVADVLRLPKYRDFSAERTTGRVASLGKPHAASLTLNNLSSRPWLVRVRDDADHALNPQPAEFVLHLAPRSRATVQYRLRSTLRGSFTFERVYLRVRSRFGLWQRGFELPCRSVVHVYPDMKQLAQYAAFARFNRLSLLGLRTSRRIGQENEFERLRDYTIDDNYKHIDWRATARRRKLTVKDFQTNQSQRIVFLVDCGRMMTNDSAGLSFLDHAFNAVLMLSYVALSHGDSVGLLLFSDAIHRYVPPRGGRSQMNHLLHACFDRYPRLVESRYDKAFLYLAAHCRKRAMVVLITNVIDEVNGRAVEKYLSNVAGRHLPLGALLRDHRLFDLADQEHPQGPELFHAAAAADILTWRHQILADLHSRGVLLVDVFPEELTAPLINRYMEVKGRQLL